jgi:hypothetical protein
MSITSLARNFNGDPNIVTMVTTSSSADITTNGFLTDPANLADIQLLNNGDFQYADSDLWLIYYATGVGFYTRNASTNAFVALTGNAGLSTTLSSGNIFVGNNSNVATGVALSGAATISNAGVLTLAPASVALSNLATGIAPAAVIKFAAQYTTTGGAATEAITVTGAVAATDRAFVQMVDNGTNNVTVLQAVVTNNTLTVTFSGDPGADTIINYQLIRAAS